MDRLTNKYKYLFVPLGVIVVFLVLIVVASNFLLIQIGSVRAQSGQLNSKIETLEARVDTLQAASNTVKDSVNIAAVAIPEKNPSVLVTRQLRKLAADNGIILSDFSIVSTNIQNENAMFTYEVNFQARGADYTSLATFLAGMDSLLPLVSLGSLTMDSKTVSGVEAQVRLIAYSAAFPESLPSLDEPLSGLSEGEQESLNILGGFNAPGVSGALPAPTEVTPRANPFSLEI